jgi:tetratricopeptide (TPR) repeat protein
MHRFHNSADFVNNVYSSESVNKRWLDYLQNKEYFDSLAFELTDVLNYKLNEAQNVMVDTSVNAIKKFEKIVGNLEENWKEGLGYLKEQITELNDNQVNTIEAINQMSFLLDEHLIQIIDLQNITNKYLGKIVDLLRIPDDQLKRAYYIDQGLMFYINAAREDSKSSFYELAMTEFNKSLKIEENDYFTLFRVGLIYLFSEKYLNFDKAIEYFLNSAKFSKAAIVANGTHALNTFNSSSVSYKVDLANAYYHAGLSYYIKGEFLVAADYCSKAYSYDSQSLQYLIAQAKYLSATNEDVHVLEACKLMSRAIELNRFCYLELNNDKHFLKDKFIHLRNDLKITVNNRLKENLDAIYKTKIELSLANDILSEIKKLLSRDEFLPGMKGLDLIQAKYKWSFYQPTLKESKIDGRIVTQVLAEDYKLDDTIYNFVSHENETEATKAKLINQAQEKNKEEMIIAIKNNENYLKNNWIILNKVVGFLGLVILGFVISWGLNLLTCNGMGE